MKKFMLVLGAGLMLSSAATFAQLPPHRPHRPIPRPSHGIWHCTAYAEGHGHSLGYDYRDAHYNHAYNGSMNRCERLTGRHCHDIHCHFDNR